METARRNERSPEVGLAGAGSYRRTGREINGNGALAITPEMEADIRRLAGDRLRLKVTQQRGGGKGSPSWSQSVSGLLSVL